MSDQHANVLVPLRRPVFVIRKFGGVGACALDLFANEWLGFDL